MESNITSSHLSIAVSEDTELSSSLRLNVWEYYRTRNSDEPERDERRNLIYYYKYCNWAKILTTNF